MISRPIITLVRLIFLIEAACVAIPDPSYGQTASAAISSGTRNVQEALVLLGYYSGPLDGVLGAGTSAAISKFQEASGQLPTGKLTDGQQAALMQRAGILRNENGYFRIQDVSGAAMSVPMTLVPTEQPSPNGKDFVSIDGATVFAIRHYNSLASIQDLSRGLRTTLSSTKINYDVVRPDWFIISGGYEGRSYYFRFFRTNSSFQGFYAVYDTSRSATFAPIVILTSLTFKISSSPGAKAGSTPAIHSIPLDDRLRQSLFRTHSDSTVAIAPQNSPGKSPSPEGAPAPIVRSPSSAATPSDAPVSAETSKRLLENIELLMGKSGNKGVRIVRYSVNKSDLPDLVEDMPLLRIVFDEKVFFDTDKSELRADAFGLVNSISTVLQRSSGRLALFVAGHTDSRGKEEYNLDLSIRRAESVAKSLTAKGVGSAAIWRVGFGKSVPIKPNDSDQNMALNRRVEFLLASRPTIVAAWIKNPKGLCEDDKGENCGEFRTTTHFEAVAVGTNGQKPIELDLPPTRPQEIQLEIKPVEVGPPFQ